MKICCFAGHSRLLDAREKLRLKLKKEVINLIENEEITQFYNGGKGDFDWFCAETVNELRKDYPFIKSYWMIAYMPKEKDEYEENLIKKYFDGTIYPEMGKVLPRFAILKRNKCMVDKSDFLIAYVKCSGGAYKTLEYAQKKKHIKTINIAEN